MGDLKKERIYGGDTTYGAIRSLVEESENYNNDNCFKMKPLKQIILGATVGLIIGTLLMWTVYKVDSVATRTIKTFTPELEPTNYAEIMVDEIKALREDIKRWDAMGLARSYRVNEIHNTELKDEPSN